MTYFSIVHVKMPTFLQCADTLASRFKGDVGHHGVPGALRHGRFPQFSIVHTITNDCLGGWWCFIIWYQFRDTSLISTKVNCKSNWQIPWESPYLIRKLSRDHNKTAIRIQKWWPGFQSTYHKTPLIYYTTFKYSFGQLSGHPIYQLCL